MIDVSAMSSDRTGAQAEKSNPSKSSDFGQLVADRRRSRAYDRSQL